MNTDLDIDYHDNGQSFEPFQSAAVNSCMVIRWLAMDYTSSARWRFKECKLSGGVKHIFTYFSTQSCPWKHKECALGLRNKGDVYPWSIPFEPVRHVSSYSYAYICRHEKQIRSGQHTACAHTGWNTTSKIAPLTSPCCSALD